MTLGIVNIISYVTSKLPVFKKKCLVLIKLVADKFLLYIVNKHQCNFFNKLFTVTGNNNIVYSTNRIGDRKFYSQLPIIVFQTSSINLIESE